MELHAAVAPDVSCHARVLVGNSVYEEADLTVRAGTLYLEFAAADINDIALPLSDLGLTIVQGVIHKVSDRADKG